MFPRRRVARGLSLLAAFLASPPAAAPAGQGPNPPPSPAAVLKGRVTDEAGRPIADARVLVAAPSVEMRRLDAAMRAGLLEVRTGADGSSGGVEMTTSGADGSFELFNYRDEDHAFRGMPGRGLLHFAEPGHIGARLD